MSTTEKDETLDSEITSAMAEAIEPYELGQQQRESIKARIMNRVHAPAPAGSATLRYTEGEWFNVTPLIEKKVLYFDKNTRRETSLWRLQPGAELPPHPHHGVEECTVIEGDVTFGAHMLRKGDFHSAAADTEHPHAFSQFGALLLICVPEQDAPKPPSA